MRKLLPLGCFSLICLLAADEPSAQKVDISKTDHFDLAATGTVRLEHSTGELAIEGWDQPQVEVTTTRSTKEPYPAAERQSATRKLDQVRITAERRGSEVVIDTALPRRHLPGLPRNADGVGVDYHLKIPRHAHLIVQHGEGEVHLQNLAGNLDVTVRKGLISLLLPHDANYEVDARTNIGGITSDIAGNSRHRFFHLGNQFIQTNSANAPKLHFRVGYGDILILKMAATPATTAPAR